MYIYIYIYVLVKVELKYIICYDFYNDYKNLYELSLTY